MAARSLCGRGPALRAKAPLVALSIALLATVIGDAGAMRPPGTDSFLEVSQSRHHGSVKDDVVDHRANQLLEMMESPQGGPLTDSGLHAAPEPEAEPVTVPLPDFSPRILACYWGVMIVIFLSLSFLAVQVHKCITNSDRLDTGLERTTKSICSMDPNVDVEDYSLQLNWFHISFKDKNAERRWQEHNEEAKEIAARAHVICYVALALMSYEALLLLQAYFRPHRQYTVHVALFVLFFVIAGCMHYCSTRPMQNVFWPLLFFFYFYIPACGTPPFTPSCPLMAQWAKEGMTCHEARGQKWLCADEAVKSVDCSPQGHTVMQMHLTWLLLQPWVLPDLEHVHMVWFWVLMLYPTWIFVDIQMSHIKAFSYYDALLRTLLLSVTLVVALIKKYTLEKSRRMKFLQELQRKASSKKIFHILEYMMPVHVIAPMLTDPGTPIADQVSRVSILFIVINDFDQFTRKMTPSELLRFLNEQFTRFDEICSANKVTKIETVGEEYVACVGVLPKDKKENERLGHGALLKRLFDAAGQILQLQTEEVKFKMGIHSGPIVAGVIGTKLPRYRLFGDTINSAARMMQKGIPGQLQFGVETHGDLPEHLLQQVNFRGDVEMKGKGKVKAYTFEAGDSELPTHGEMHKSVRVRPKRRSISETAASMDVEQDDEVLTGNSSFFEEALTQMQSVNEQEKSQHVFLSERHGFTDDLERKWQSWFHESVICHKITRRLGLQSIIVLTLTAFEMVMLDKRMVKSWHPIYKISSRLAVFVYCRGAVLLIGIVWWYFAEANNWIHQHPGQAQMLIQVSACASITLIYVSYDALVVSNTEDGPLANLKYKYQAPPDQIYPLSFVLFVFLYMRSHALRFVPSLVFIPLAVLLILGPSIYNLYMLWREDMDLKTYSGVYSFQGALYDGAGQLIFLAQALIIIFVAHSDEQESRARYKMTHVVQETQQRTEGILDTLMPPLVVKGLRELPPNEPMPTDQYRHATIAQSDLCGFTQLSATRKPTEVVKFMGDLFGAFDLLTDKHGVYKVETVGDAYIAGMAEKPLTKTNSPYSVLCFGLDMVRAVDDWALGMGVKVTCRVGIAYGECIGGIVGTDMQRYHLFGDLLSCMEILESTAPEARVQISNACKKEVERQLREEMGEERPEILTFLERQDQNLKTSKGEVHEYSEVGGTTFLVQSSQPLRKKKQPGIDF